MEEQRDIDNNKLLLSTGVCIIVCVLLGRLSVGSLLFNLPLLLLVPRIKKTSYAVLSFAVTMLLVIAVAFFDYRSYLKTPYIGSVLFTLFFQVTSSVGCMIWTALRNYSKSVLRKLVICSFPIAVLGFGYSILLGRPFAAEWVEGLKTTIKSLFDFGAMGIDVDKFADVFFIILKQMTVPFGMIFSGFPIIISELVLNKRNESWQNDFAYMKMPNNYIWVFMGAWLMVILSGIIKMPSFLVILFWNVAIGLSLHYFIGGVSVAQFFLRKKIPMLTANRIVVPVLLLSLMPGVNIVVISGFTILGALETFIKFR